MTIRKKPKPDSGRRRITTRELTQIAILVAIIVVLQSVWTLGGITSFSVVLIPIVIGAILMGPGVGALLGFVFGAVVVMMGITGKDFFTATLFQAKPIETVILCLGKGCAAGAGAGWAYKLLHGKVKKGGDLIPSIAAAAAAPVLNTGLFILGAFLMHRTVLSANLEAFNWSGGSDTVLLFLIVEGAGVNFLVEFTVNVILAPTIYRIVCEVKRLNRRNNLV